MFKKTIKYSDWNGVEKERDLYFNLTETEINHLQMSYPGGLKAILEKIVKEVDNVEILKMFDLLVEKSYGEKSPDGEYFRKSPEIFKAFTESVAYDEFFKWLLENDGENSSAFANAIIPPQLLEEAEKNKASEKTDQITPIN